jgi:hypothetical protein
MRRISSASVAIGLLLAAAVAAFAAAPRGAASAPPVVEQPVSAASARPDSAAGTAGALAAILDTLLVAEEAGDPVPFERYLAADYLHSGAGGELVDRAGVLELLRSQPRDVDVAGTITDVHVVERGETAYVSYRVDYRYAISGEVSEASYRAGATFARAGSSWTLLASHAQRLDAADAWETVPADDSVLEIRCWPEVALTAAQRAVYVGEYDTGDETVRVWEEDGILQITPGSESETGTIQLVPMGDHVFAQGQYEAGELARIFWPEVRIIFTVAGDRATGYELRSEDRIWETAKRAD